MVKWVFPKTSNKITTLNMSLKSSYNKIHGIAKFDVQ